MASRRRETHVLDQSIRGSGLQGCGSRDTHRVVAKCDGRNPSVVSDAPAMRYARLVPAPGCAVIGRYLAVVERTAVGRSGLALVVAGHAVADCSGPAAVVGPGLAAASGPAALAGHVLAAASGPAALAGHVLAACSGPAAAAVAGRDLAAGSGLAVAVVAGRAVAAGSDLAAAVVAERDLAVGSGPAVAVAERDLAGGSGLAAAVVAGRDPAAGSGPAVAVAVEHAAVPAWLARACSVAGRDGLSFRPAPALRRQTLRLREAEEKIEKLLWWFWLFSYGVPSIASGFQCAHSRMLPS
ncbi:MAG: hypothetical protein JWN74_83 [Acidobacteriaceae bacterium]|nr:hypothetical protein [Acidobacteriaceae bacterium]